MPSLNDSKYTALGDQGFTGAINDRTYQWLNAFLGNVPDILALPDLWSAMLDILISTSGSNDSRWYMYLILRGFNTNGEHINDMELEFWLSGGVLTTIGTKGFSTGFDTGFQ
jgi:hypothetical protein